MYPSKGTNPYGHQPYGSQQTYAQIPGSGGYGAPDASLVSRISSAPDADVAGYRSHPASAASQYGGGAYSAAYNSSSLTAAPQGGVSSKQPGPSSHTGLSGLGSNLGMPADEYLSSSSRGYGAEYIPLERRHYSDHPPGYGSREMPADLDRRYADSVGHSHQAASIRQQQLLKAQLAPSSDLRQSDYYSPQDPYAARGPPETDPRTGLSILGSMPYRAGAQASLLATDPRRNDSLAASYGVSLPPGRDYSTTSATSIRDVLRDEDLRRDLLLREKERERERDRERDRLRDRERDRERERERDREREREREKEREREREKERQRVRERERELERKLAAEPRRDRSKDRRGSSVLRDDRGARRVSPRRDSVIRPRSPVREKKREYVCKVSPFCLVDAERDYPSLTKRYPRLAVTPDFSKVVVNWSKESMNLSLYTPVSFEHDFVEVDGEGHASTEKALKSQHKEDIVWNVKVLMMSGISNNALSELCSSSDERATHLSHVLKFAVLRKDRELLAIGGAWNPSVDGGDPLISDSGLIKAAIRHVKENTQVDLQGCQHWNRFLEIHYERVGKEGIGNRKEVTVLFVPNLSECIPAIEAWRSQWLAHKKALAEREQKEVKKHKEKKEEKKESKEGGKSSSKSETSSSSKNKRPTEKTEKIDSTKAEDRGNKPVPHENQKQTETKEDTKTEINVENNEIRTEVKEEDQQEDTTEALAPAKKFIKKKIVKRVIKRKATGDDASTTATATAAGAADMVKKEEIAVEQPKDEGSVPVTEGTKTKKKIIRRVVKRKVMVSGENANAASERTELERGVKSEENKGENLNPVTVADKSPVKIVVETQALYKEKEKEKEKEQEKVKDKADEKKKVKEDKEKKIDSRSPDSKQKSSAQKDLKERPKHEEPPKHPGFILQGTRNKGSRIRSTTISLDGLLDYNDKDIAESTFEISLFAESLNEMFQYQMGCRILSFLEKLRRRYLLKKNQRKREREREEKEKEREKESEKKRAKKGEVKDGENKEKESNNTKDEENNNTKEKMNVDKPKEENKEVGETNKEEPEEIEEEPEEMEEEPEEIEEELEEIEEEPEEVEEEEEPEEMEEELEDAPDKNTVTSESAKNTDVKKPKESEKATGEDDKNKGNGEDGKSKETSARKASEEASSKEGKASSEKGEKEEEEDVIDKDLLQAFRYFDQNRVGFIKVEDLRCIIHNLGKFLSHRDVKEMVQTALFESNSVRDNRIFYPRLVKISDL